MAKALRYQTAPLMWERLKGGDGPALRVGSVRLRLADVRSIERSDHAERDLKGVLVMGAVFTLASAIMAIGVFDFGWRTRYLLGAAIFFALGLISLYEAYASDTLRFVRLKITTHGGETVFTTANADDAAALQVALTRRA